MRGHFHRDSLRTFMQIFRQQPMHAHCVRRGVCSGLQPRGDIARDESVSQGADHGAALSRLAQRTRDPVTGRSLAVGSGDTHHPQLFRGCAVCRIRQPAGLVAQIGHRETGHLPGFVPGEMLSLSGVPGQQRFIDHRVGALRDRRCDELPAIGFFAGIGNEGIAIPNGTAVGHQPCHRNLQCSQLLIRPLMEGDAHTSSFTMVAGGAMTLSIGASFGTLSACNDAPVTLLNTGAATCPP